MPGLEEFVIDVVTHTSGFIVRKIRRKKDFCNVCDSLLVERQDTNTSLLLTLKNRGKLINVSSDVRKICLAAEYIFRFNTNNLLKIKNIKQILCSKTINEVSEDSSIFNCETMKTHILNQCVFDNHRNQLIKIIIDYYVTLRLHHFAKIKTMTTSGKNVRRTLTKLILFNNQ